MSEEREFKASSARPASPSSPGKTDVSKPDSLVIPAEGKAESTFWNLFQLSSIGLIRPTPAGRILQANPAFCRLTGYTEAELQTLSLEDITHPADRKATRSYMRRMQAGKCLVFDQEKRFVRKDGKPVWAHISASWAADSEGRPLYGILAVKNIGERKTAEERLRLQAQLLESVRESVVATDLEGRIIYWGRGAEILYGYSRDEAIGRPISIIVEEGAQDKEFERSRFALKNGLWEGRYVQRRKDGSLFWADTQISVVRDGKGKVCGLIGIDRDVSTDVETERERRLLQAQIIHNQKLESLGVLAGGIAHDFNNLLMGVLGNTSLALMDIPEDSHLQRYLLDVQTSAQRAADLTRQILAYAGQGQFDIRAVNLNDVVQEMRALLKTILTGPTVLELKLSVAAPWIQADTTQLRQVILNLITNASEAIEDDHGRISVLTDVRHCRREDFGSVFLGQHLVPGDYVSFQVQDTGCGMDRRTLSRIFDPFFTTKFTGRGLGLPSVLGIIRAHGGGIRVSSEVGKGTCIELLLPLDTQRKEANSAVFKGLNPSITGDTILVVDDEKTVRKVSRSILEKCGLNVMTAKNGGEGIEIFRRNRSDINLVLLDVTMPGLSALQVLDELRFLQPGIHVIVMSGYGREEIQKKFAGHDLAGILHKPYKAQELIQCVRAAMTPP